MTNAAGEVVIPKGSEAELVIRRIASPGAVTGTSELALDLQSIKVGGRRYTISTADVEQKEGKGLAQTNGQQRECPADEKIGLALFLFLALLPSLTGYF